MRFFCFVILVLILGALAIFAVQNERDVTLTYFNESNTFPLALILGVVYLLGMISGWSFWGLVKRSLRRATEERRS
jgi:uncharacterized integral membrane protein